MTEHVLQTENLVMSFKKRRVVSGVSVQVKAGEVVGLLGPNGAGKTTTFYMILGLLTPEAGRVCMDGEDITYVPVHQRARKGLGFLPQEPSIFRKLTVEQNLRAIAEARALLPEEKDHRVAHLLEELNLTHLAHHKAYTLSGGERRRAEIARALVTSPLFLLLDEPFAGIDPIAVADIQNIVAQLKKKEIGILITDHNVRETLRVVDRAYIIHDGKVLLSGTATELASDETARQVYLGEQFHL